MTRFKSAVLTATTLCLLSSPLLAQGYGEPGSTPEVIRDEMLGQFSRSSDKMTQLSEAVPAELYGWSPGEGVMTVARVYAHIAHYNFMYLAENLGITAPEGVDWENLESLTDKTDITAALRGSIAHVKEQVGAMTEDDLTATTVLYGREVPGWAVLVQLVAHMNEHVGQSVAYARVNGIVPPWSR